MQRIAHSFNVILNNIPRSHRVMMGSLTIITLAVAVWQPYIYFPIVEQSKNNIHLFVDHNSRRISSKTSVLLNQTNFDDEGILKDELEEQANNELGVNGYIISTGDTLSNILTQYGIDIADVTILAQQHPTLRNLKIGQSLSWQLNSDGNLQNLTWNVSRYETRNYNRIKNVFKEKITNITGEWKNAILTGQLDGNFVISARAAGMTGNDINAVIKALQWQLDFHKLRKGDQFSVLTAREMLSGKSSMQSQLLGVHFRSGNKDYYAFRADNGKFYNLDATSLTRGFMRFPTIKQFFISSNFNLRRLNPVTGRIAPHRGVDFAVPIGTPVLAVGDGEVIVSKHDSNAGNYVTIRHGRQYVTRYMHLKKLLVKPGQKVKRGDRIALSGNTGRSTGPHLHYEIWINQQAVNPLKAKLPINESLTGRARIEFFNKVKQILPMLALN